MSLMGLTSIAAGLSGMVQNVVSGVTNAVGGILGLDNPSQGTSAAAANNTPVDGSALFQTIEQSVLASLRGVRGNNPTAVHQAIQSAIKQVLQTGTATSNASAAPAPSLQSFMATLQGYGINAQQFGMDYSKAVQQVSGGAVDPAAAYAAFPQGLLVNTFA